MTTQQQEQTAPRFDWMSEYRSVEEMLVSGRKHQVGPHVREAARKYSDSRYLHIFLGLVCRAMGAAADAVKSFEAATVFSSAEVLPGLDSPATQIYVETQLQLTGNNRPCNVRAKENFRKNIDAIRAADPELGVELEGGEDVVGMEFIDLWGRLHFYYPEMKQVLVLTEGFPDQVQFLLGQWLPLAIMEMVSGQELPYILDHQQKDFLLGRKRIIYWFEGDLGRLRGQLCLRDFSAQIGNREIVLFGGRCVEKRINEFFGSYRYPAPQMTVGDTRPVSEHLKRINEILDPLEYQRPVEEYYRSSEYLNRLRRISEGKEPPRILVSTCRWTTVLQYCAGDFRKAFEKLGCVTSFLIEEDDLQTLSAKLTWKRLAEFRPDFLFSVSHARPSYAVPRELPVIGYIQDRCGPVLNLASLKEYVEPMDVWPCLSHKFLDYLSKKGIPAEQIAVMPVPADESKFYPLAADDPLRERFACDISYVKHGVADPDQVMADWMASTRLSAGTVPPAVMEYFRSLYRRYRQNPRQPWHEEEVFAETRRQIGQFIGEGQWNAVEQMLVSFQIQVLGACFRFYYLEALTKSGLAMWLYGNQWANDALFKRFAAGSVKGAELNAVYNFSRINLHMNPTGTMHQRLCEGGLAGGFFLVSTCCDPAMDWEPASNHFISGKEMVQFDSPADLVDKCRYYLAHPQARADIAANMRSRALKDHTCLQTARRMLDLLRNRIHSCLEDKRAEVVQSERK